jgi:hypothetical protein
MSISSSAQPEREKDSPSVYLTADNSAESASKESSQWDFDQYSSGACNPELVGQQRSGIRSRSIPTTVGELQRAHPWNDPSSYVHAHRKEGDSQRDNPWFDRFEYVPSRRPVVVDYGNDGPQWDARKSRKRTANGKIKEFALTAVHHHPGKASERYTIVYRTESRSHIPQYLLEDRRYPNSSLLRVSIFDITDYISLSTLHAFENEVFESEEPPESDFVPWDEKYPMLRGVLDSAAGIKKPERVQIPRNPHIEVVIFQKSKARSETPLTMPAKSSSHESLSPTFAFQPKPETLAKLEDDTIADSQLVDTLIQEAADAEMEEPDELGEYIVAQILDHKNWLGVRHYQVAWMNAKEVTWVSEEELEGIKGANDGIRRYLKAEETDDPEAKRGSHENSHDLMEDDDDGGGRKEDDRGRGNESDDSDSMSI